MVRWGRFREERAMSGPTTSQGDTASSGAMSALGRQGGEAGVPNVGGRVFA